MLEYLREVYYGENANLREMQKCISNFRKDLFEKRITARLNTHPEIKRFNRLAEKEFGFKGFCLHIDPAQTVNAYTFPLYYNFNQFDPNKNLMSNLVVTNKGYRFKKEAEYVCYVCVYRGIMNDRRLSDREIMAIILHEIGHNFQAAISDVQSGLSCTALLLYLVDMIYNVLLSQDIQSLFASCFVIPFTLVGGIQKFLKGYDEILYKYFPNYYHITDVIETVIGFLRYPIDRILRAINMMLKLPTLPIKLLIRLNPLSLILFYSTGNFRGEKMADNFPTMYGYGLDLALAVTKIEINKDMTKIKIPLVSPVIGIIENTYRLLITIPDEHPAVVTRINDQLEYLKKEMDSEDFDSKFKKEVEDSMKNIQKQLDFITSTHYKGALSDYQYSNHLYQLTLYKLFGGDPMDLAYKWSGDDIHRDVQNVHNRKRIRESGDILENALLDLKLK